MSGLNDLNDTNKSPFQKRAKSASDIRSYPSFPTFLYFVKLALCLTTLTLISTLPSVDCTNPHMFKLLSNSSFYASSQFGSSSKPGHVLFVSVSIRGHFIPLQRMAQEMADRGYHITWAVQEEARDWADTIGDNVKFVNLGKFPVGVDEMREKLKHVCI